MEIDKRRLYSYPMLLLIIVLAGEVALGLHPHADRATWLLENFPTFLLIPILIRLQPKLKITQLTLTVLAFHAFVLMMGGFYTYARVPIGYWLRDALELKRNNYDRFGHLMQGFGPALGFRELLIKRSPLKRGWLLTIVVFSMCMGFSALYELFEWGASVVMGGDAEDFLATQGDPFDTQWDMFCCLIGSSFALLAIAPWQDRQMERNYSAPWLKET